MKKKRICIVTANRAEYSRVKTVLEAISKNQKLEYILIVIGSHLLRKYGNTYREIERDGFTIHERIYNTIEGENPVTMAKSAGFAIIELATLLDSYKPDFVVVLTDRYETLSAAVTAAFLNIPVAHIQGGEVTGTIDESIRHAVTKFAHVHFAASEASRQRIIKLGETPEFVFNVGCPATDLLLRAKILRQKEVLTNEEIKNPHIKANDPFIVVLQHPVTTEFGEGYSQIEETLYAIKDFGMQTIMLWPNVDAGSEHIVTAIRRFLEEYRLRNIFMYRHITNSLFIQLLYHCKCLIGNSSSGIRESCYFGTPVVNIGTRQHGRERGKNVVDVGYGRHLILKAIKKQVSHGRYPRENVFGKGDAGRKIADILSTINGIKVQKIITY
ncbi:MAG: UDP-N-acetyl-D-glucosamine 2-epimerase, UDP-hydrolysing [Omnitrophica WOR_2 bacterium GWF2_43_52]|nr:MAG: UDP-N-acetyl-D-glucosamine 2-epimerase, UDP-hydrolysing [Omnitrophica WOR_2 bacterium GWF2_43_52]OGX55399.1 MAG: UDP-N-acetyl-D-glucosamine 2-epimerase, UDP-hydrolysing [Omnitrophica WOR_2 bacterium RIFOXYC2_FULL_43_9]HAH20833.1 UDP-N-acetylglucosamine 2-epimerase (hydrolyzing) [Candidatus Omnitrophota bacterium]HBG64501.1 UDP-N-acetylglucosamine 2-epimerase (hydrolyzing) [Candidatus Omnitrophota bacterium]